MIRSFVHHLPRRILLAYRGSRWVWHAAAALITVLLVLSGDDWAFYHATRSGSLMPLVMFAGITGFLLPFLVSIGLYIAGHRRVGILAGQSFFTGWFISSFYKVFTGRAHPVLWPSVNTTDTSHQFSFGIFQHGIFWGWPSSHAATAVAGAVALYILLPNRLARILIVAWAAAVCAGAAIGFHWLSDVVAGAIIGAVIGYAIAKDKTAAL